MMNTNDLQQLKMAWIAAREAGDKQKQLSLFRDYPEAQEALIDFAAAYQATEVNKNGMNTEETPLLPLTQRGMQRALANVFEKRLAVNLHDLRVQRGLSMLSAAQGLRLGVDVWKKFEDGTIELLSLSKYQLERFAQFFQVSVDQFSTMLTNSQPTMNLNRRQTANAARQSQGAKKQSFAEALEKSTMTKAEIRAWLEN